MERARSSAAAGRAWIGGLLLLYLAASLLHFAHNAQYLADYPNLPAWLTRQQIYLVWLGQAALGIGGYALYRNGARLAGLLLVGLHAALGFDGLLHYTRARPAAHTAAMNLTIWLEIVAAGALAMAVVIAIARPLARRVAR